MVVLPILFLGLLWINREVVSAIEACRIQNEICRCEEDMPTSVVCDQDRNRTIAPSVSLYLTNLTSFTTIRLANKNWNKLSLDDGFSFTQIPGLVNLGLDSNSIETIDDDFFSTGLNALTQLNLGFNRLKGCFNINAAQLLTMSLMSNQIQSLNESCFRGLNKLQGVRLVGNLLKILYWTPGDLLSLRKLELSRNFIESINSHNLESIEYLDLSFNFLNEQDRFESLTSLKYLKINSNRCRRMPYFVNLTSLEELELNSQYISSIDPGAMRNLTKLKSLTLRNNMMRNITNFVFNYSSSMISLDLSINLIELIESNAFAGLNNLLNLNLSWNVLENITASVFRPLSRLQSLNLNRNSLSVLSSHNFANLSTSLLVLNISYNKINYLKRDWLSGLSTLIGLNLSFNSISSIESGSFDSLTSLASLDISNNCVYKIEPNLFGKLSKLVVLLINDNLLAKLDPRVFTSQQELVFLYMQNNQLWSRQPTSLFNNLTRLEHLDLSNNHLSMIDSKQFEGLYSLQELNLAKNYVTSLNNSVDSLTSLRYLDLSRNKIKIGASNRLMANPSVMSHLFELNLNDNDIDIDKLTVEYGFDQLIGLYLANTNLNRNFEVVGRLQNLSYFGISHNRFERLNVIEIINDNFWALEELFLSNICAGSSQLNFSNLYYLRSLDLSYNMITEILEDTFIYNWDLEILDLSHNQISFINEESFTYLEELVRLDLSFNSLKTLDGTGVSIKQFPNLKEFRVNNNSLDHDEYKLDGSAKIIFVNFSSNRLKSFSLNARVVYSKLAMLNLSSNLIKKLRNDSFLTGAYLRELDLSYNQIQEIPNGMFDSLNRLEKLYINNNNITHLLSNLFDNLVVLKELCLQFNQIKHLYTQHTKSLKELKLLNIGFNNLELIEDNSLLDLGQLVELDISSNPDLQDFTNQTFNGFSKARLIVVSRLNQNNFQVIKEAFKASTKKNTFVKYYQSVDILYNQNVTFLTKSDCKFILELIKVNLKLNLFSSTDFDLFLFSCQIVFQSMAQNIFSFNRA